MLRARWWVARAEALQTADPALRLDALEHAAELFAKVAPDDG